MSREGLEHIYPTGHYIEPLYPEATNDYLNDIPRVDTHNTEEELVKRGPAAIEPALEVIHAAVRGVEEKRRQLAYYASIFAGLVEKHPEYVANLAIERRMQVEELASRAAPPEPEESINSGRRVTDVNLPLEPQGE